ncbi:hypothetical protein PANN_23150 [Pseudomonas aeruginosa C-NN2]|nr:hypothetical protein PANN_23150 [Pseudomonas aeruginosa C-NN2]
MGGHQQAHIAAGICRSGRWQRSRWRHERIRNEVSGEPTPQHENTGRKTCRTSCLRGSALIFY